MSEYVGQNGPEDIRIPSGATIHPTGTVRMIREVTEYGAAHPRATPGPLDHMVAQMLEWKNQVATVRAIHIPIPGLPSPDEPALVCAACDKSWPCRTAQALGSGDKLHALEEVIRDLGIDEDPEA